MKTVISASRRTDIPAFYSDWFFKRMQEGYALTANPMNPGQVRNVSLKREDVECIVFWTKNPESMLPKLGLLEGYPYYFQFTLNPYDSGLEPGVPNKSAIIDTFRRLSETIGPERVIWRYDPVIYNSSLNTDWHEENFLNLSMQLQGYTEKCILSFIDYYRKIDKNYKNCGMVEPDNIEKRELAGRFAQIARENGLKLDTCAEEIDLSDFGVGQAHCIDPTLIEKLSGSDLKPIKDRNQRQACGCYPSADIGTYNTCPHGCIYCYANHRTDSIKRNMGNFDPDSPILCGKNLRKR